MTEAALLDGTKIKMLRERKEWTQGELAYHTKVDQSLISRLESGATQNVRLSTAKKLAGALGVTLNDLMLGARRIERGERLSPEELEALLSDPTIELYLKLQDRMTDEDKEVLRTIMEGLGKRKKG